MPSVAVGVQPVALTFQPLAMSGYHEHHHTATNRKSPFVKPKWSFSWQLASESAGDAIHAVKKHAGNRQLPVKILLSTSPSASSNTPMSIENSQQNKELKPITPEPIHQEKPIQEPAKIQQAQPEVNSDSAWGPIFQNREHFLDMHIC
jgi:hypothetical protein